MLHQRPNLDDMTLDNWLAQRNAQAANPQPGNPLGQRTAQPETVNISGLEFEIDCGKCPKCPGCPEKTHE